MAVEDSKQHTDSMGARLPATVRRRRTNLLRGLVIMAVSTAGLVLFVMWYKAWPQKMDCARTARRLAHAIDDYRTEHRGLPTLLEQTGAKAGRYPLNHYDYRYMGFGGPAHVPDGTIIAQCAAAHTGIFHEAGRHVFLIRNEQTTVVWMTEPAFQELIRQQRPVYSY